MGLLDLFSDVVEVASNVGKVVLAPIEVVAKGTKEVTKVAAELAENVKDAFTGDK